MYRYNVQIAESIVCCLTPKFLMPTFHSVEGKGNHEFTVPKIDLPKTSYIVVAKHGKQHSTMHLMQCGCMYGANL